MKITFELDMITVAGKCAFASDARERAHYYDGKSAAHYRAWVSLAAAVEDAARDQAEREGSLSHEAVAAAARDENGL
jgi:hypothetical protein